MPVALQLLATPIALATFAFFSVAPTVALAQVEYNPNAGRVPQTAPGERSIPNVPDSQGCVALCDLDTLPCDPPLYKKLDGRCTLKS